MLSRTCIFSSHPDAPGRSVVEDLISSFGYSVVNVFSSSDLIDLDISSASLLISDRTKFIIPAEFLLKCDFPKINTHPSLLPFHRGSYPIFWTCLLNHRLGVSFNELEPGIDTGSLCYQKELSYSCSESFRLIHSRCRMAIFDGLAHILQQLTSNESLAWSPQQPSPVGAHSIADAIPLLQKLPMSWDTPLCEARQILEPFISINHYASPA